jgi:hypothetical protein
MFNEVRMFQGEPVRLWSAPDQGLARGRYVIFPSGRMVYLPQFQIVFLPHAPADAVAFPAQDQGDRM